MSIHLKELLRKTITAWQSFSCSVLSGEDVGVEQPKLESFVNNYYENESLDLRVEVGVNLCKS